MPPSPSPLTFSEPRLLMTRGGRFFVRAATNITYSLVVATTIIFFISGTRPLRAASALLLLFLIHRIITLRAAPQSLARLPQGPINTARYLAPMSYRLIEHAYDRAIFTHSDSFLILLKRLLERKETAQTFLHLDVPLEALRDKIDEYLKTPGSPIPKDALRASLGELVGYAFEIARATRSHSIEPHHLLAALGLSSNDRIKTLFTLFDITPEHLQNAVVFAMRKHSSLFRHTPHARHRVMNRAWTARPTPALDAMSEDITDRARREGLGAALLGHQKEFEALLDVLARPGNPNVLLVGEPGIGKTALLEHFAYEMSQDRVPPSLFDKRLVSLDMGSLTAGADTGVLEARLKRILREIREAGNIILVVPHLQTLFEAHGTLGITVAEILIPAIKSDAFPVIGMTTPRDFKTHIEPSGEFGSSFTTVRVEEITEEEATRLLTFMSMALEENYKVLVSFTAVRDAVRLAHRYFRTVPLPGSAVDLLKEAFAEAARKGEKVVKGEEVQAVAERRIKVPLHRMGKEEKDVLLHLEETIHERFVDQEEAVAAVGKALREYRTGLGRRKGPIATFLFVGPTGVGKTELAKILAALQFGSEQFMLRFDMSEYQTQDSVYRLIGTPDEKVHGALTDAVLEKPYSLILLDEFEKAHHDILNIFLQVFDDGRLTDSLGRTVSFEDTIIIATSNAHSDIVQEALRKGESMPSVAEYLKSKLTDVFKAELLNRFSGIIVFKDLGMKELKTIVGLQLKELTKILGDQGITLRVDEPALEQLAKWGYDPQFGARPLRRMIEEKLKSPLSEKILRDEVKRGDTVTATLEGEMIQLR